MFRFERKTNVQALAAGLLGFAVGAYCSTLPSRVPGTLYRIILSGSYFFFIIAAIFYLAQRYARAGERVDAPDWTWFALLSLPLSALFSLNLAYPFLVSSEFPVSVLKSVGLEIALIPVIIVYGALFVLWVALQFFTTSGSPEPLKAARTTLTIIVLGFAVICVLGSSLIEVASRTFS
jgi:hypothetical protein